MPASGTRALHHHHPDVPPPVQLVEGRMEGFQQLGIHRVALIRPVQRDGGDAGVDCDEDFVGHVLPP
jgi:hypothetical protein